MDIKTLKKIIKLTPTDQAIGIEGKHGIGKSEIIAQILLEDGYKLITLFVGQMADAGDAIGLPDKIEATFRIRQEDGTITEEVGKITKFAPPAWWPQSLDQRRHAPPVVHPGQ